MEDFGTEREPWLRQFPTLENGIPSHDTFSRLFRKLGLAQDALGDVLAVDGKARRREGAHGGNGRDACAARVGGGDRGPLTTLWLPDRLEVVRCYLTCACGRGPQQRSERGPQDPHRGGTPGEKRVAHRSATAGLLRRGEGVVAPALLHQRLVGAGFHHFAVGEKRDPVRVAQG